MYIQYMAAKKGSCHRRGNQPVGRERHEEVEALFRAGGEPVTVRGLGKAHQHAFFFVGLMVVAEQRMVIGIDGEHREALVPLSASVPIAVPKFGYAQRSVEASPSGTAALPAAYSGLGRTKMP